MKKLFVLGIFLLLAAMVLLSGCSTSNDCVVLGGTMVDGKCVPAPSSDETSGIPMPPANPADDASNVPVLPI